MKFYVQLGIIASIFYVGNYHVQPNPVEFTEKPKDLVFFNGGTVSLYCETNCIQLASQWNSSCAVAFLYNGIHLDYHFYAIPYDHTLSSLNWIGRRKLTIFNASDSAVGKYQCVTDTSEFHSLFTDKILGKPVHVQMAGSAVYLYSIHNIVTLCVLFSTRTTW